MATGGAQRPVGGPLAGAGGSARADILSHAGQTCGVLAAGHRDQGAANNADGDLPAFCPRCRRSTVNRGLGGGAAVRPLSGRRSVTCSAALASQPFGPRHSAPAEVRPDRLHTARPREGVRRAD